MLVKKYLFSFLLILPICFLQQAAYTQCTTPINSFPYNEDFELNDGNWTRSSASHWEWGQIVSKPVITAAGGGSKCWVVGGFSGSQYNSGNSSLQSPCFDISSLSNPEISFKLFWETELKYDGATLQFSTNGGASWINLGSTSSNLDCTGQNWFNYNPINFLGGPGWSGNVQSTSGSCQGGGGSGGWLTAKHSLSVAAGSTGIIFRFNFGAGTTCNGFDGFAIDDIRIGEATANTADFTYTCSADKLVDFNSDIVGCKTTISWDFDDTGSGTDNTSTLDNPSHIFVGNGDHTVTLTVNFVAGPSVVIAKTIRVIDLASVVTGLKCNGDINGAVSVSIDPPGTYNYTWDTSPPEITPAVSNLPAGTYTVVVTAVNTCSISKEFILNEPELLNPVINIFEAKCGSNNGSITTSTTGGTAPYTYTWSNAAVSASITGLAAGVYSLQLKDANGCVFNSNALQVNAVIVPANVFLGKDTSICPGEKLLLKPGNFASYKWQDNSIASTYTVTSSGTYSVLVTDQWGCTGSASIKVSVEDCSDIYFPSAFTPNGDNRNDGFGPLPYTALSLLRDYKLTVYGRWGEVIFTSNDPYKKWDGTYKGKELFTQSFTWTVAYTQKNLQPVLRTGTVSIIH